MTPARRRNTRHALSLVSFGRFTTEASNLGALDIRPDPDRTIQPSSRFFSALFRRGPPPLWIEEHCQQRERLFRTFDRMRRTKTGRHVVDAVTGMDVLISFDPNKSSGYADITPYPLSVAKGRKSEKSVLIIGLSVKTDDIDLTSDLYHELRHAQHFRNRSQLLAGVAGPEKFADKCYRRLVGEADAWVMTAINSYEVKHLDNARPWNELLDRTRLGSTFILPGNARPEIHSKDFKRQLFRTWMTSSLERKVYETRYLAHRPVPHDPSGADLRLSLKKIDLACVAREPDGTSYLDGVDLTRPEFTGLWGGHRPKGQTLTMQHSFRHRHAGSNIAGLSAR